MTRHRGQSLVEFALVLPVIFALIFGVIDGGRLVYSMVTLDYAVNEGARLAGLPSTASVAVVQNHVTANAYLLNLPSSSVGVTVNGGAGYTTRVTGDRIVVSATYVYQPIVTSMFGLGFNVNLAARSDIGAE